METMVVYESIGDGTKDRGENQYLLGLTSTSLLKMTMSHKILETHPLDTIDYIDCYKINQLQDGGTASGAAAGYILGGVAGAVIGGMIGSKDKKYWCAEISINNHITYFRINEDLLKDRLLKWASEYKLLKFDEQREPCECTANFDNIKEVSEGLIDCPFCGCKIPEKSIYCPSCREKIDVKIKEQAVSNNITDNSTKSAEKSKSFQKPLIIVIVSIIIVMLLISMIALGSSNNTSNSNLQEETVLTNTKSVDEDLTQEDTYKNEEAEIEAYIDSHLEFSERTYVSISENGSCIVSVSLDDEHKSYKKYYGDFAEEAVTVIQETAKKYKLDDVFIMVDFYLNSDLSSSWATNDFGITGVFSEIMEKVDYKNSEVMSLEQLKEKYEQYK